MTRETILSHLSGHPWRDCVQVFDEVESTNTLLKALGREGAPEGTVLIADRQTGGRGRLGRTFLSPGAVGIYFSILLRPNCPPGELMHLTCAAATAMCDAVEESCGVRPRVKWINDLVLEQKKLGGILTELNFDAKTGNVDFAVIGVGINCHQQEEDFDPAIRDLAISLEMNTGKPVDRSRLAAQMIQAMYSLRQNLHSGKEFILSRYKKDCLTLGKEIQVIRGDTLRRAYALDLDQEGALIVRYADDGSVCPVSSGEVSVRGMYGYV